MPPLCPPPSDEDDDAPTAPVLRVALGLAPPDRLDKALTQALAEALPEGEAPSRSRLARLLAEGAVTQDGRPVADAKARPQPGAVYEVTLPEAVEIAARPEAIALSVMWEDADLIVIDKPAGMVVHPAPGSWSGTLVNALLHHCGDDLSGIGGARRPGIVHRIDKDTSGLLVVAKSDRAHRGLAAQFADHSVTRRYLAVVHGHPDAADPRLRGTAGVAFEAGGVIRIATNLDRHAADRQRQAVVEGRGRAAVTRVRVIRPFGAPAAASLMECWLETGRTHQIRVHMAHAGHGLIGDPVYGGARRLSPRTVGEAGAAAATAFPRQALHAATLGFDHPVTGARMDFAADLPADMAALIAALGAAQP
ncbi:MAG: RluA family pseudouridine synthase [Gemmobacter sp.]